MNNYSEFKSMARQLSKIMHDMFICWESNFEDFDCNICREYPFDKDFMTMCLDVSNWAEDIPDND